MQCRSPDSTYTGAESWLNATKARARSAIVSAASVSGNRSPRHNCTPQVPKQKPFLQQHATMCAACTTTCLSLTQQHDSYPKRTHHCTLTVHCLRAVAHFTTHQECSNGFRPTRQPETAKLLTISKLRNLVAGSMLLIQREQAAPSQKSQLHLHKPTAETRHMRQRNTCSWWPKAHAQVGLPTKVRQAILQTCAVSSGIYTLESCH